MSQNEKELQMQENGAAARHKVIADLHSGMVLLAPVATKVEDLPQEPEDLINVAGIKNEA
jgi:hypothetical protein